MNYRISWWSAARGPSWFCGVSQIKHKQLLGRAVESAESVLCESWTLQTQQSKKKNAPTLARTSCPRLFLSLLSCQSGTISKRQKGLPRLKRGECWWPLQAHHPRPQTQMQPPFPSISFGILHKKHQKAISDSRIALFSSTPAHRAAIQPLGVSPVWTAAATSQKKAGALSFWYILMSVKSLSDLIGLYFSW